MVALACILVLLIGLWGIFILTMAALAVVRWVVMLAWRTLFGRRCKLQRVEPRIAGRAARTHLTPEEVQRRIQALRDSLRKDTTEMDNQKAIDKNLRRSLMWIGGSFTITMANSNITPEEVAAHSANVLTEEQILRVMTGSEPDITIAKLSYLAGLLGSTLVLGVAPLTSNEKPEATPASAPHGQING